MKFAALKNWLSMGCALVALVTTTASHADKFYYVHNDPLGTPQVITDENKNVVWEVDRDPWGNITNVIVDNLPNNVSLPGQYDDVETGYSDNGWRPYDKKIGQYLQSDPIGLAGGINTYAYVSGNPVMLIDPEGLMGFGVRPTGGTGPWRPPFTRPDPRCMKDFWTAFKMQRKYLEAPRSPDNPYPPHTPNGDTYMHCLISCKIATAGGGSGCAKNVGDVGENTEDDASDNKNDQDANKHGRECGKEESCEDRCKKLL